LSENFDFDREVKREFTASLKYDGQQEVFGRTDIIPMWVADMDFAAPAAITRALVERATHPVYGYTIYPDSLYDSLINWLKHRHGWHIKREWIVMCPGVVPSLHAAILAFTKPDESVIVQPPVYFPFFSAITNTGRSLIQNPLRLENNHYTIDFEHLELCAANARMLLLCSPHNPVGRVWTKDELKQLLQIAEKYELVIFSDEIHADLIYPDFKHHMLATLSEYQNNIVTALAPSKTFNIPGLNLSVLIIPDAAQRSAINKAFDITHVNAANPFSIVAFEAAYRDGEAWLDALLKYLKETRDFVANYLITNLPKIHLIAPEGTYLLWLDCRALGMNDAELKHFFVHVTGVGLSPGTLFGESGSGYMRMNIGTSRHMIAKALDNIAKALARMS
jgi:cystathionine beta-lyase